MAALRTLAPWTVVALAACFAPVYDAPRCGPGDTCPSPLVCQTGTCVAPADASALDSDVDGDPGPVDACTPRCERRGMTDVAVTCAAPDEPCPLGCATGNGVHCQQLVPSNGVTEADLAGADVDLTLEVDALYLFDTEVGLLRRFALDGTGVGVVVRASGTGLDPVSHTHFRTTAPVGTAPGLAILGVGGLTIPATTVLRPIGARAMVIVARGPIVVAGEIDVGAGRASTSVGAAQVSTPGPGGGRGSLDDNSPAQGCAPGGNGNHAGANNRDTGGGGGGFILPGGRGGGSQAGASDGGIAITGALLAAACMQSALVPLRGGGGGGAGQVGDDGGGGGGALQLTSLASILVTGGTLYAGGAGGDGSFTRGGGGGGGAGGGLLLEAPVLILEAGRLITSGGGGGDGNGIDAPGENGRRNGQPAPSSGLGGRGATGPDPGLGEFPAADGTRPGTQTGGGTGGGGGGAGIVHLRSVSPPMVTAAVIRPSPSTSGAVVR